MAVFASSSCAQATSADGAAAQVAAKTMPVTILSNGKTHRFNVEVARTFEEQQRGLMFRTFIAPDGGMIFPLVPPRVAKFWMKNCPIPQDWIFIRADGSIARLIENTVPYSLDPQGPDEPVAAVLEIAGGRAAELGITEDSIVRWQG
ncbi:MAG: DUF192 domain-containing protein [Sphingomonadaceae bacterium]